RIEVQLEHPRVAPHRVAGARADHHHRLHPVLRQGGEVGDEHLAHDLVADEHEQLVLVADVVVEGHRPRTQLLGQAAHREGVGPLGVDERHGRPGQVLAGEASLPAPRRLPAPQLDGLEAVCPLLQPLRLGRQLVDRGVELLRLGVKLLRLANRLLGELVRHLGGLVGRTPCHVVQRTATTVRTMYESAVRHAKDGSAGVTATGLGKRYGDLWALRGLDLEVPAGQVLGLLGHNGAGKSTTIQILTTLARPTEGTAAVAGFDVTTEADEVRRRIGVAAQEATVDGLLSARLNLELVGRLHGRSKAQARARADELLELVGLADAADRLVKTLSGGMRRRLDLAASLVARPQVLFLDEPTTGLDPRSRTDLWDQLRSLVRDR